MTRFARAKGSKASNERVCEEATSWEEMKNQLLQKQNEIVEDGKRKIAEERRNSNYQKFLKDREEQVASQTEWAEFPNDVNGKRKRKNNTSESNIQFKRDSKAKKMNQSIDNEIDSGVDIIFNSTEEINESKKHKKNSAAKSSALLKKNSCTDDTSEHLESYNDVPEKVSSKLEVVEPEVKKVKQKKKLAIVLKEEHKASVERNDVAQGKEKIELNQLEKKEKNTNNKKPDFDSLSEADKEKFLKKKERRRKQIEKKKLKKQEHVESDNDVPEEVSSKLEVVEPKVKKVKQKKKKLAIVLNQEHEKSVDQGKEEIEVNQLEKKEKNTNNKKRKEIDFDSLSEADKKKVLKKQERRRKQVEKKKLKKQQKQEELEKCRNQESTEETTSKISKSTDENSNKINGKKFSNDKSENSSVNPHKPLKKLGTNAQASNNKNNQQKSLKKQKSKDGDFKRRKDYQPNKMMINGKEVDLEYFDGFPIKKDDAQNLKTLKKEMISKGLPRSEINRTLKLERRKAEKALTREKKKVCFNCRKFGHNLSECQELSGKDNNELIESAGIGVCFKCGSTEHTSFVCRVVQGQNFKFATCFICKEQGHISRQCPDNARGLYPKGGACKICGDVTHLKKDCTQFQIQQEKEHAKFSVESFSGGNPEDLDGVSSNVGNVSAPSIKQNKIVKF